MVRPLGDGLRFDRHLLPLILFVAALGFSIARTTPLRAQCDGCCHQQSACGCDACDSVFAERLDRFFTRSYCLSPAERRGLADKHAPAGLMGDHVHHQGEMMFEYRYMNMYMDDNLLGTNTLSDAQALTVGQALGTNFAATPTQMTMEMHMIHAMYGLTDNTTLYVMPMFSSLTMDHIRGPMNPAPQGPGSPFTTHNSGFDDMILGALIKLYEGDRDELVFNLGCSVPTGYLDRVSSAPTGGLVELELPYPMRRGSGTFDARPGLTYKSYFERISVGGQFQTDLPIGRNDEGYSVGNEWRLNGWISWLFTDRLAFSYRTEFLWRENFDGADADLVPAQISTARPDFRGGDWINFGYGVMALLGEGHLLNFEAVHPVYQNVDGIQLESDWWFFASWSKAFD